MDPVLPILFFTHNRTETAIRTLHGLFDRLDYPSVHYLICDDRSTPDHLDTIRIELERFGKSYKILSTNTSHYGLGASMNNGLHEGFQLADVVLRMEDDWFLTKPFQPYPYIDFLQTHPESGAIRLGMMFRKETELKSENDFLFRVYSELHRTMTFNNQIAFVHKRVHDELGFYEENVHPDIVEKKMAYAYNRVTNKGRNGKLNVYWPVGWPINTYGNPETFFLHIGDSTIGHTFR